MSEVVGDAGQQPIRLNVARCLHVGPQDHRFYVLAGQVLAADAPVAALEPFRQSGFELSPTTEPSAVRSSATDPPESTTSARGWLAGETRDVVARAGNGAYELDVSGIGRFTVDRQAQVISCDHLAQGVSRDALEEVLLGPPIALALALRDVWCLHASAVVANGRATLFVGASGQGKSTLAAQFAARADAAVARGADDIVPCAFSAGKGTARLHFPQLKLAPDAQYPRHAAAALPIHSIMILDPGPPTTAIEIVPETAIRAANELVRQTVVVTLFDRPMHVRHLRFVGGLVSSTPVFALKFPHDYRQLPLLCDRVASRL